MGYTILKQDTIPACAGLKMASEPQTISTPKEGVKDSGYIDRCDVHELFVSPLVCGHNYMELFRSVPEVFFPIDYIASRISGSGFQLKKVKDDSVVWETRE